jgi:hypothetical protein
VFEPPLHFYVPTAGAFFSALRLQYNEHVLSRGEIQARSREFGKVGTRRHRHFQSQPFNFTLTSIVLKIND